MKVLKVIPLQSSASRIYLNVTTIESKNFTVALTGEGFRVVAEGKHDSVDEENHLSASTSESTVFETPYSLLGSISPGFRFVNVKEQTGEILGLNKKYFFITEMRSGEDSHLSWKKCSRASRRRKRLSKVD